MHVEAGALVNRVDYGVGGWWMVGMVSKGLGCGLWSAESGREEVRWDWGYGWEAEEDVS